MEEDSTPPPPSGPADDHGDAAPDPGVVTVPYWAALDWRLAIRISAITLLGLVLLSLLITLVLALALVVGPGADVAWQEVATAPVQFPLGYLGGIEGFPVLATGLIYLFVILRFVCRRADPALSELARDRARLGALAVKIGVVAGVIAVVAATVLAVLDVGAPPTGRFLGGGLAEANPVGALFLGFTIATAAAALALMSARGIGIAELLGLSPRRAPQVLRDAWLGTRTTLTIAIVGLLALLVIGVLAESLSTDGLSVGDLFQSLLLTVVGLVLLMWLDTGLLFLVVAMAFLQTEQLVGLAGIGRPSWLWFGVAIVAVAFLAGGYRAAAARRRTTLADAVRVALLSGAMVAAVTFPFSLLWANIVPGADIVTAGLLLPLLWSIVAASAGWLYAAQRNLPSGISVSGRPSRVADVPTEPLPDEPLPDEHRQPPERRDGPP